MKRNYKDQIYMFEGDKDSVYLSNVVTDPDIQVGEHTYYNDFLKDPRDFQKNNVLYHHPEVYHDKIVIGKYCSIACGTKFLCTIAHHSKRSLAYYPFPIAGDHWNLTMADLDWVDKGPTIVGNDVWFGYDCVIMPGVHIGDGAAIGTRAVVTKDVPPYTVVAGNPAKPIKKRFDDKTIEALMELKWWDLPEDQLRDLLPDLVYGRLEQVLARKQVSDTVREILSKHFPQK